MSNRFIRGRLAAVLLAMCVGSVRAQTTPATDSSFPRTGLDLSGVDAFWPIVEMLSRDQQPTDAQWHALTTTPGYRLAQMVVGKGFRDDIEIAFKPSRRAAFDSLTSAPNDRGTRLRHLARAASLRPQLRQLRDSLGRHSPVAEAVRLAARFLPPGSTDGEPPFVAFAFFREDGYALFPGVIIDLLHLYESNAILSVAHELHHAYVIRAYQPPTSPNAEPARPDELALRAALQALRMEGLADLIDKPFPLTSPNPVRAEYVKRYNEEYAKTRTTLRTLDSLLTSVAADSTKVAVVGNRARMLLWSNGHANGAFMARTVYETFGVDSLFPSVTNPASLFRAYASAERAGGRPAPFSAAAWTVIEGIERRSWRTR
jgi:hypothetical protein